MQVWYDLICDQCSRIHSICQCQPIDVAGKAFHQSSPHPNRTEGVKPTSWWKLQARGERMHSHTCHMLFLTWPRAGLHVFFLPDLAGEFQQDLFQALVRLDAGPFLVASQLVVLVQWLPYDFLVGWSVSDRV